MEQEDKLSRHSQGESYWADRRAHVRKALRLKVLIELDDLRVPATFYTVNVSAGGMFVGLKNPPPIGSMIKFVMMVEPEPEIRGIAHVVWVRQKTLSLEEPNGMAMEYRFFHGDGEARLIKAIA